MVVVVVAVEVAEVVADVVVVVVATVVTGPRHMSSRPVTSSNLALMF